MTATAFHPTVLKKCLSCHGRQQQQQLLSSLQGGTFLSRYTSRSTTSPIVGKLFSSTNNNNNKKVLIERVLQNPQWPIEWPYTDDDFTRIDESDDIIFYNNPRLVYHIDDPCVSAITQYYSEVFTSKQQFDNDGNTQSLSILDLCSSWVSHYPKDIQAKDIIGLGMNEYELQQNKQLTSYVVQDLNVNTVLPFNDTTFDIVTCVVSIDYLNKPLQVFNEIGRVLKPNGTCIISISNRYFPTKAIRIWLQTSDIEHVFIIGSFFHYSTKFYPPIAIDRSPNHPIYGQQSDPLYIIQAMKK